MPAKNDQRQHALKNNLPRYNTSKPCKHNHYSDRYTKNGQCVECSAIHNKAWHQRNKEKESIPSYLAPYLDMPKLFSIEHDKPIGVFTHEEQLVIWCLDPDGKMVFKGPYKTTEEAHRDWQWLMSCAYLVIVGKYYQDDKANYNEDLAAHLLEVSGTILEDYVTGIETVE